MRTALLLDPNVEGHAGVSHQEIHVHQALLGRDEVDLENARGEAGRGAGKGDRQYGGIVRVVSEPLELDRHAWRGERSSVDLSILAGRIGLPGAGKIEGHYRTCLRRIRRRVRGVILI